jgi:hypothetical protein
MRRFTTIRICLLATLLIPLAASADTSTPPIDVRAYDRCPAQTVSSPIPFTVPMGTDSVTLNYEVHGGIIPEGFLEYIGTEYDHQCVVNIPTLGVDRYTVTVVDPTGVELFTKTRPAQRTRYPVSCQFPYPETLPDEVVESLSKKIDVSALTADGEATLTLTVSGCNTNGRIGYVGSSYIAAVVTMVGQPVAYVDVDDQFDPANPESDYNRFIPGSQLDGTSIPPEIMGGGGQRVKIHIVSKPLAGGTCRLTLSDVSRHPGIAMNYPLNGMENTKADLSLTDRSDDEVLSTTVPLDDSGDTVVPLFVRDYAAQGKLKIEYTRNAEPRTIFDKDLPKDVDGNALPDAGWWFVNRTAPATYRHVKDEGLVTSVDDEIADPPGVALPAPVTGVPKAQGISGDGLTAFEEYRGFVVNELHTRTNPHRKDLFLRIDDDLLDFDNVLLSLPLTFHYVKAADVRADPLGLHPLINMNRDGSMTGASDQYALRVRQLNAGPTVSDGQGNSWPAYSIFLGRHFEDGEDVERVDLNTMSFNGTPNETRVVEVYSRAFGNDGISHAPGMPLASLPPCIDPAKRGCDEYDADTQEIRPGQDQVLDTVRVAPDLGVEFLTRCTGGFKFLIDTDFASLKRVSVAHESAHGLLVDHADYYMSSLDACQQSVMYHIGAVFPVPRQYHTLDEQQVRLHVKHP